MRLHGLNLSWFKGALGQKVAVAAGAVLLAVAAYCWGRYGVSRVLAQTPNGQDPIVSMTPDYGRRVVAYLYDSMPITREDLGEYLIARFGAERVEFLVNRRIVETACKAKGVYVTDAEVQAQLEKDVRALGSHVTISDFTNQILKRFNKSLYEWKEDVIRPKLALAKLVGQQVQVTEEDLHKAFEARYGPKVQCRMIVLQKDDKHKHEIWQEVSDGDVEKFKKRARECHIPQIASSEGMIPPVHKHFGDPNVEKAAYALKKGEVSALIQLKEDGSWVIVRCEEHIPAERGKDYAAERLNLYEAVREIKLAVEIPKVFQKLREEARPKILMERPVRQEELERAARRELSPPPVTAPATPPADRGTPPVSYVAPWTGPQGN